VGGGYITEAFGWRWVFLVNLPIAIVILAIIALTMPRKFSERSHKIDYAGGVLLALATIAVVYWSDHVLEPTGADWMTFALPVVAVALIAAFIMVERRAEEPIIPLRLFANRTISLVTVISVLGGMSTLGLYFYFALYMQTITGLSPGALGLLFVPMSITVAITGILAGRVVAATGRYKWLPVVGSAIGVGLMLFYALADAGTPLWVFGLSFVAFGLSMGLTMQTLLVAIQAAAPLQDIGAATGLATQARTVGASLGLALNGAVMVLGLTTATRALPADVLAAIPAGLSGLAPKVVDALPDATREVVLHAYFAGFSPVYWFAGGVYLLTVVLTMLLPNVTIPKRA
jgi:predicted MFS family arabinose efflux permease